MSDPNTPRLYIIFPFNIESLVPGKLAAQAAHAANQFESHMYDNHMGYLNRIHNAFKEWKGQADGFGTTYVLRAESGEFVDLCVNGITSMQSSSPMKYPFGVVTDPTYPIKDGEVTHYVPVDTCAWLFLPHNTSPLKDMISNMAEMHFVKALNNANLY